MGLMVAPISMANPLGSGIHPCETVADGLVWGMNLELYEGTHGDIHGVEDHINSQWSDVYLHPMNCHNLGPLLFLHISVELPNDIQVTVPRLLEQKVKVVLHAKVVYEWVILDR